VTESADGPTWIECGVTEADLASLRATNAGIGRLIERISHNDRPAAIDALFHLKNEICHQGMAISATTPRERVEWEVAVDRIFVESRSQFEALRGDSEAVISQFADELAARSDRCGPI
jgi:hypothetical protein